jgi:hypothetical protein
MHNLVPQIVILCFNREHSYMFQSKRDHYQGITIYFGTSIYFFPDDDDPLWIEICRNAQC